MNNQKSLEEWANWLVGQRLGALFFNFTLMLYLQNDVDKDCRITIESAFSWTQNGSTEILDPLQPINLAPLLGLLNYKIGSACLENTGLLTLDFKTGQRIQVKPDDQYEAWNLRDEATKAQIICSPGGGLC